MLTVCLEGEPGVQPNERDSLDWIDAVEFTGSVRGTGLLKQK